MPALDDSLHEKIALLHRKGHKRELRATARTGGVTVMREGRELVSFSCNDYLGLSHDPGIIAAAREALETYGAGAGASRLVTGNIPLYNELETALAAYKDTEACVLFGSGYLANIGTIPALVGKGDLILADKFVHACMVDAARLSGATVLRFAHNNLDHCRLLLAHNRRDHHHCLLLTETVFSMDGDRAPLQALKLLAAECDAWLMSDDAHGLGVIDDEKPSPSSSVIRHPSSIHMGTLSKAAGSYGGYVCGSKTLIEYLKTAARSLIFSTALPPATLAASLAAIRIIASDASLTAKPLHNARLFTSLLGLPPATSAIVPLILEDNERAMNASLLLESRGFLVAAIRPPTVPEHTARLRFAFSALHSETQITALAAIIKEQGWV